MDVVKPTDLGSTPDLAEALAIVRRNPGSFGTGSTPTELLRMIEWFVDPPCELVLVDVPGGKLSPTEGCICVGDSFQFTGTVRNMSVPKQVGHLRYDVHLSAGDEHVHLDLYLRDEDPPDPAMSMRPHLRRAYEAMTRVGIRRLELEAGLEDGPTYWARAGVDFTEGRPLLSHLESVAAILAGTSTPPGFATPEDVRQVFPGEKASVAEAYARSVAVSASRFERKWVTNDLLYMETDLGIDIDKQRPLGEAILFAISPWDGHVDLSDPGTSDARYRAFLGL